MDIFQILALALIQGLTEFLPISSSAHLILPSQILGWQDQGLAFDVAVHVGSLLAVVIYFRRDVFTLFQQWVLSLAGKPTDEQTVKLAWYIVIATIPACIAGAIMDGLIEDHLRSVLVIAGTTIGFGVLLGFADLKPKPVERGEQDISIKDAVLIGLAQALALVPGTSRSGATMTAALLLNLDRKTAAKFSFLLSIPLILAAGLLKTFDLSQTPLYDGAWVDIGLGTLLSFMSAYLCIFLFLKAIGKIGFMPFAIYRLLLGGFLLYFGLAN